MRNGSRSRAVRARAEAVGGEFAKFPISKSAVPTYGGAKDVGDVWIATNRAEDRLVRGEPAYDLVHADDIRRLTFSDDHYVTNVRTGRRSHLWAWRGIGPASRILLVSTGSDGETTELPVHFHLEMAEELANAWLSNKYGEPRVVFADWAAAVGWTWETRTFKDFEEWQATAAKARDEALKEEALSAGPPRPISP